MGTTDWSGFRGRARPPSTVSLFAGSIPLLFDASVPMITTMAARRRRDDEADDRGVGVGLGAAGQVRTRWIRPARTLR